MSFKESLPSNNEFETHASLETKRRVLPRSKPVANQSFFSIVFLTTINKSRSYLLTAAFFCPAAIHMTHPRNGNYSTSIKYRDRESDLAPPLTFEATGRV